MVSTVPTPPETDFLWFVLFLMDNEGFPVMVWPTAKDQQQHDGWEHEFALVDCVPRSVILQFDPDTVERTAELEHVCADFLRVLWCEFSQGPRLAYFSSDSLGEYVSLRTGSKVSGWDIRSHIESEQEKA